MNILSETFYSKDGQSCKSVAFYSLKQSAIETLYNIEDTEDFTAWGTQTIQDNNIYIYDPYYSVYPKWNSDGNNSSNNGRKNSLRIIKELRLENKGDERDGKKFPTIKLKRLNPKSIRNYTQKHELVEHGERDAANRPYFAFEVYYKNQDNVHKWSAYKEEIANGGSFCPDGYRLPNQRELILMVSKMQNAIKSNGGWPQYTACRTSFSFYNEENDRVGFTTDTRDGLHVLLINKKGVGSPNSVDNSFRARCIRDITE